MQNMDIKRARGTGSGEIDHTPDRAAAAARTSTQHPHNHPHSQPYQTQHNRIKGGAECWNQWNMRGGSICTDRA